MNQKTKFTTGILLVLAVVLVAGYFIYKDVTDVSDRIKEVQNSDVVELPKEGELPKGVEMPDLDKKLTFDSYLNENTIAILKPKIEDIRTKLKETPTNFRLWMDLAANYKVAGDYKSAEEAWYYAHLMIPDNSVVMGNLANLYAYYIKDNTKAEEYFIKAINAPGALPYLYYQTADFYVDIMKDNAKALEIAEQGLKKMPNDVDMKALVESIKAGTY